MKLYRSLMGKYADGENVNDVYHVYGMAVAYETVGLLKRLGANPTRAALMVRASLDHERGNPFLLPGVSVKTGKGDSFLIQQGQLQRWTKGRWVPFGGLWVSSATEFGLRARRSRRSLDRNSCSAALAAKLERLFATLALNDVEAADGFLRLGERAVRDERSLAGSYDGHISGERLAQHVDAAFRSIDAYAMCSLTIARRSSALSAASPSRGRRAGAGTSSCLLRSLASGTNARCLSRRMLASSARNVSEFLTAPLDELLAEARRLRTARLVTYSPKVFIL